MGGGPRAVNHSADVTRHFVSVSEVWIPNCCRFAGSEGAIAPCFLEIRMPFSATVLCPHPAYEGSRGESGPPWRKVRLKPQAPTWPAQGGLVEVGGELSPSWSPLVAHAVWSRGGSRPNDLVPASLGASVSCASCNCSPRAWERSLSPLSALTSGCEDRAVQVEETTRSSPSLPPPRACPQGRGAVAGGSGFLLFRPQPAFSAPQSSKEESWVGPLELCPELGALAGTYSPAGPGTP